MNGPLTLAIDIGGSGSEGHRAVPRPARWSPSGRAGRPPTRAPRPSCSNELTALAATQPEHDRVSVGFPGAIRKGRVREVPAFSRRGPGLPPDPELVDQWTGFELETALAERFGKPTRVANDADVQGCAVISGHGMELVITLGTGVGCAVFFDGSLLPHMELSHGTFGGTSIEVACGDNERQKIGKEAWRKRVLERARRVRGDGAARPPLHRWRQRQEARPGHRRPEPHDRTEHLGAARRHRPVGADGRQRGVVPTGVTS